ncbi:transglutaminase family protein [Cyanobium sp. Lug-B]|jgi:transglutaminase-like putative cysteine protease|uniref:transglutaminase family protein n=1 Tax=Cyanobium sp. Lug-B TaxID=2823716 RepID=UPI0020CD68EA|nr:transglutaminase family protein [Cyanobium sp. Lug-B]MCP9797501.1 transglutaminase family protein [Cyanobium sp. Lug-B]MCP9934498.1 transglutaminase family protein [Cyanobium sp. Candia 9D4]
MRRFRILHLTTYTYTGAVQLGAHILRLRPREGHDVRIETSTLTIQPAATLRWHRDVEDNCLATASFHGTTDRLRIESSLVIQHYDRVPLDFLVEVDAVAYPFRYAPNDRPLLDAYRDAAPAQAAAPSVCSLARWVATVWQPGEAIESYALLKRLNRSVHQLVTYRQRDEPGVQSAADTLSLGCGSCRDIAFLFMEAARVLGFAARFVSGYSFTSQRPEESGSTHAWAEVFLPGAGWKGFDPTLGALVGDTHIPVAVARRPEAIPPIAGSFRGAPLGAMEVGVWVTELQVGPAPGL